MRSTASLNRVCIPQTLSEFRWRETPEVKKFPNKIKKSLHSAKLLRPRDFLIR